MPLLLEQLQWDQPLAPEFADPAWEAEMKTLDPRFVARAMPPVPVKGKTEPIATFAIESFDAAAQSARRKA